jgi:hypothetical protein
VCQIRSCIFPTERVSFFPRFYIQKSVNSSALEQRVPSPSSDNSKMTSCKHDRVQTSARSAKTLRSTLTKPSHSTRMHTN